jgi:hypothetical protein
MGMGMAAKEIRDRDNGIVLAAAATGLAFAVLCLVLGGIGKQGTMVGLRATAVLAVPFLVGTYAAPALRLLWPGKLSEWLLTRRRALGLAFSAVLAVHLVLTPVRLLLQVGEHWVFVIFTLALVKGVFVRHSALYLARR